MLHARRHYYAVKYHQVNSKVQKRAGASNNTHSNNADNAYDADIMT